MKTQIIGIIVRKKPNSAKNIEANRAARTANLQTTTAVHRAQEAIFFSSFVRFSTVFQYNFEARYRSRHFAPLGMG
jgi:hypothetical protein